MLLLAGPTLVATAQRIGSNIGLDFYNFWGVSAARSTAGQGIGDPYRNGTAYLNKVRELVRSSADEKLAEVSRQWPTPDFTGTPLLYAIFSMAPQQYSEALSIYQAVQVVAFLAACLLLARLYRVDLFSGACMALISLIGYQPFVADLRVANLGCIQFALITAMLVGARSLHNLPGGRRELLLCSTILAALAVATFAKPNIALITVLVGLHVAIRHGRRVFLVSAGAAAVAGLAGVALPCLYFGTWSVWNDWYAFVYGSNAGMLVRSVADGNYSTVVLLAHALGTGVFAMSVVVGALLFASLGVAAMLSTRRAGFGGGDEAAVRRAGRALAKRLGEEPELALALGVGLTMATSPLLWFHYDLIALIPCFWLLRARSRARSASWLAAASIVLSSGIPGILVGMAGWPNAVAGVTAIAWVPLWAAVLAVVARRSDEAMSMTTAEMPAQPLALVS